MIPVKNLHPMWRLMLVIAGVLLIYAGSQFSVMLPGDPIPQTGQTLAVVVVALLLAPIDGVIAVSLYVVAGIAGLPVFSDGAYGFDVLLGPSGGYLIGFILAALFLGNWVKKSTERQWGKILIGALIAHVIILVVGGSRLATMFDIKFAWVRGVAPFLTGALIKSALGALVVIGVLQLLRNYKLIGAGQDG